MDNNDLDILAGLPAQATTSTSTPTSVGIDLSSERSIITARGTGDGLVIRADGRAERKVLKDAFEDFVRSRKRFMAGNDVSIEWIGLVPDEIFVKELINFAATLDIDIVSSSLKIQSPKLAPVASSSNVSPSNISSMRAEIEVVRDSPKSLFAGAESSTGAGLWDEADARIIASTIRGGQKIETEHSIVIFGDVNSGAELIAGGDIIVLGTLRGVAHAGAYDETGGGRVIFSLNMQATQLRIGSVISRGNPAESSKVSEIARVDGTSIVVEPYQAKTMLQRRRDQ